MDFEALWLTLRLAIGTTAILLVMALPQAWWIASGRGAGRALVQAVVALPLVLPPTVLGFYLLVALGPLSAPGRLLIRVVGHPLAFSFAGLLVGSVIYRSSRGSRSVCGESILERGATVGAWIAVDERGADVHAHGGRVRCGVDAWRKYSRVDPNAFDFAVRQGAGVQLRGGEPNRVGVG